MYRYGLVYLWHNRELQNQNRSLTKERREGQPPSPRRRNPAAQCQKNVKQESRKSIRSNPFLDNAARMGDAEESQEIRKIKVQLGVARRGLQRVVAETGQLPKRLQDRQAAFNGLPGSVVRASGCQKMQLARKEETGLARKEEMQLARKEGWGLQKERLFALEEIQSKERLWSQLQCRKCGM